MGVLTRDGRALQTLLYRVTLREDAAEDLMQELFLRLSRSDGFAAADEPGAYARRAAVRLAFDWRRANVRRARHEAAGGALARGATVGPAASAVEREDWQRTLDAVAWLPEAERDAVVLRYLDGRGYDEVADETGRSVGAARALCQRALRRLRMRLVDKEAGDA